MTVQCVTEFCNASRNWLKSYWFKSMVKQAVHFLEGWWFDSVSWFILLLSKTLTFSMHMLVWLVCWCDGWSRPWYSCHISIRLFQVSTVERHFGYLVLYKWSQYYNKVEGILIRKSIAGTKLSKLFSCHSVIFCPSTRTKAKKKKNSRGWHACREIANGWFP